MDDGGETGGPDRPAPPVAVTRLIDTSSSRREPSPAGVAPAGAQLRYLGGRVISNVQVVQVIYGAGDYLPEVTRTAAPSIPTFYQQVTNSVHFDWLGEYNTSGGPHGNQVIGHGSFAGQFQITPAAANNSTTISDANIKAELARQINAGLLPSPTIDGQGNSNTYYAIFFPHGKKLVDPNGLRSCENGGFCAYHGTIANIIGREVYYGVHADMQLGSGCEIGCGGGGVPFAYYQAVASHELVEAVTDPEVGLASRVGAPLAWYDSQPFHGEIGDLCNGQQDTIVGGDGQTYTVQREFSNVANDCIGTRPPRGPTPFYQYFNGVYHFYTAYFGELGDGGAGYHLEYPVGNLFLDPVPGHIPLYRYVSLRFGAHFYTTFFGELGYGVDDWKFEGIAGYMPTGGANTTPFYRYGCPQTGDHYYTANFNILGTGAGGYQLEQVQSLIYNP